MFHHIPIHPRWTRPDSTLSSSRHDNKHEWVGTSGLKQLLLMLVGFIYLLWQWQVMQWKGVQLPQHVTVEMLLSKSSKREEERESGFVSERTRVFCLPGTSEDDIALHRCHRTHRRINVYWGGTNTGNREETQSMQCIIWCMIMTWQYECVGLMQLQPDGFELIWTKDSNTNSSYGFI